jgi:ankyrin repeat protein
MWLKRNAAETALAFFALLACFIAANSNAQEQPVKIERPDPWNHYIGSPKMIHSSDAEAYRFGAQVVLDVIVSTGGDVESAHAVDGPKSFFSAAESIERDRQFKPFEQDGIPVRALIKDWVGIVPPEQWADKKIPFPEIKNFDTLRMSLSRTGCFGSCPGYSVEIRGNGDVIYHGNGLVLITGEHRASIPREAVANLLQSFRDADYFSLKDGYTQTVTDNPTYTTSIEFDGHNKSVTDYVGAGAGMPDVVTELEEKIDQLAGTDKWIKETSQTWPALRAEHWNFRADNEENRSLFASVVARGSSELVEDFIAAGAPALTANKGGQSAVVNAAEKGNLDLVRRMLGKQTQLPSQLLFNSLRAAAHSGNVDLIEFLIGKGARVNGVSENPDDKETVLIGAASRCHKDAVQDILRYHPNIDAEDYNGNSALSRFLSSCSQSADLDGIFELLVSAGANVNSKNDQGWTPLFNSCWSGHAVALLAEAGADLNAKDESGQTALMHCVNAEFAKAMIAAGADLYARDRDGQTAAQTAREMGIDDKAKLLETAMKLSAHQQ